MSGPPSRLALLILCTTLVLSGCARLFFHPERVHARTPAELGYRYRDVVIGTRDDLALHAWLIEPEGAARGSVYFLHGNAENVSTHVLAVLWLVDAGYRVLALDYRGYGRSEGSPDLPEVLEDLRAGGAWLFAHLDAIGDEAPVHLLGQSLGASLAIAHLARHPAQRARVATLVAEAAFTRYGAIARHVARGNALTRSLGWLAERMLSDLDDPVDAIGALEPLPVLLLHSRDDEIVPYAFGRELERAAGEPSALLTVRGPHIAAFADAGVRAAVLGFMRAHEARVTTP